MPISSPKSPSTASASTPPHPRSAHGGVQLAIHNEPHRSSPASSSLIPACTGHRRVRAGVGAAPALDYGLHLPRAPRRGDLPLQGRHAPERLLPPQRLLSFQEDAIGIRLRDVIGVDNMMWRSDNPHSESTFPQSRKVLAEILKGVPEDEQAKIAGGNTPASRILT